MATFAGESGVSSSAAAGLLALMCCASLGCGDSEPANVDAATQPADAATNIDASSEARFRLRWTLDGGCDRGDEIESTISSLFDGRTFVDRFPCDAGEGVSSSLASGEFEVVLRLIDTDVSGGPDAGAGPTELVAISEPSGPHLSVPGSTAVIDVAFPTTTSTITASWNFSEDSAPQSCAEAGVTSVDVVYERDEQIERSERVACEAGMDVSGALPTGHYTVTATPVDAAGDPLFKTSAAPVPLFVGNQGASTTFSFVSTPL